MENERPNYFAVLPANVRYDKRLKSSEKLLYGEITALSNREGYCFASNKYFADLYDVSIQSVSNWINHLAIMGYVEIEFVYKENTKEIAYRKIIPLLNKTLIPIKENFKGGIKENFKDNNININNNINNNLYLEINNKYRDDPEYQEEVEAYCRYLQDQANKILHRN